MLTCLVTSAASLLSICSMLGISLPVVNACLPLSFSSCAGHPRHASNEACCGAERVGGRPVQPNEYRYASGALGASGAVNAIVILSCCTFPKATVYVYGARCLPCSALLLTEPLVLRTNPS